MFAEAELSLGGLLCVCVLVFRSSPVSQADVPQPKPTWRSVQRGREDLIEVRVVELTIFAASLSFSPIIDLIKHDYQHYRGSLLWLFVSISVFTSLFYLENHKKWSVTHLDFHSGKDTLDTLGHMSTF